MKMMLIYELEPVFSSPAEGGENIGFHFGGRRVGK